MLHSFSENRPSLVSLRSERKTIKLLKPFEAYANEAGPIWGTGAKSIPGVSPSPLQLSEGKDQEGIKQPQRSQFSQISERVLGVRHLPWNLSHQHLQQLLQTAAPGAEVVVAELRGKARGTASGADHKGYALLRFKDSSDALKAMESVISCLKAWGGSSTDVGMAPMSMVPQPWQIVKSNPDCGASSIDGESGSPDGSEAKLRRHREHMKRSRKRQSQQRADTLEGILNLLSPPGGRGVTSSYLPLYLGTASKGKGTPSQGKCVSDSSPSIDSAVSNAEEHPHSSSSDYFLAPSLPSWYSPINWEDLPLACHTSERHSVRIQTDPSSGPMAGKQQELESGALQKGQLGGVGSLYSLKEFPVTLRVMRKKAQVESFLLVLRQMLQCNEVNDTVIHPDFGKTPTQMADFQGLERKCASISGVRLVDFGSGSGNLLLPLAYLLPSCSFHGVDIKETAVKLLLQRAETAGLKNVSASVCRIEDYSGDFDVALALHACGSATDNALLKAQFRGAAFICSPCCIGKITTSQESGALSQPRSTWMTTLLGGEKQAYPRFLALARAADISHKSGCDLKNLKIGSQSYAELALLAKSNLELDRLVAAQESGYVTVLSRLLLPDLLPTKSDLLVGAPSCRISTWGLPAWARAAESHNQRLIQSPYNAPLANQTQKGAQAYFNTTWNKEAVKKALAEVAWTIMQILSLLASM